MELSGKLMRVRVHECAMEVRANVQDMLFGRGLVGLFGALSTSFRTFLELLLQRHVLELYAYPRAEMLTPNFAAVVGMDE